MATTFTWSVRADVDPSVTNNGITFTDVVRRVHWRLVGTTETDSVEVTGSEILNLPTSMDDYIDLTDLQNKTDEEKRAIVIGWAEERSPGFLASAETSAQELLDRRAAAAPSPVTIL